MDYLDELEYISKAMLAKLEGDETLEGRNKVASLKFGLVFAAISKKIQAAKTLYTTTDKHTLEIPKEIWQNIEQHSLELATLARGLVDIKAEFDKGVN